MYFIAYFLLLYLNLPNISGTTEQIAINIDISTFLSCSTFEFSGTKLEQLEQNYPLMKQRWAR